MAEGWISLHRKFIDWEWYDDNNVVKLFIHCLLKANHKEKSWKGIVVPKGSFITGRKQLAIETKLSEQQIRTALNKLKSTNEITIKATNLNSIISITNWDFYQDNNQQTTKRVTTKQPTNNQQVTTTNNDNNVNNDNKIIKLQNEFKEEIKAFKIQYDDSLLKAFFNYWSEPTKDKTKMRKDLQKTWDTKRRLVTWFNRSQNGGK
jgi:hypothetical protein